MFLRYSRYTQRLSFMIGTEFIVRTRGTAGLGGGIDMAGKQRTTYPCGQNITEELDI